MVARGIRKSKKSDRARKPRRRRPRGIKVIERHGHWHAHGTVRTATGGVRVRESLGLAVDRYSENQAEDAAHELEAEIRARAQGKAGRGAFVSVAALAYLSAPRARPLRPSSVRIVKAIVARFGDRRLNTIAAEEWFAWIDGSIDGRQPGILAGRKSATRERFLNTVCAFLKFCKASHGLAEVPAFRRDRKAVSPNRRARRRVEDLRIDLIRILLDHCHVAIRAQLAAEISTGARVSSVLHGVRICDLILAPGREALIYRGTKSGEDVAAVLDGNAVAELKTYLAWRGKLHDREAPLFLTPKRQPYADNGGTFGSQNKTGFNGAKARAVASIRMLGAAIARRLRHADRGAAIAAAAAARSDAALLGRVTQHWFRHRLATLWIRRDPRAAMEQGGWLDIRSMMGYAQDVQEFRRQVAGELDAFTRRRRGAGS